MRRRRTRQCEWPRWQTPKKQGKPYNGGKAKEEHLTMWKDGHEKNSGMEPRCDSVLESRKMTRTTGEKMEGMISTNSSESKEDATNQKQRI